MAKERISKTGVSTGAPIVLYGNSPETTDLSDNYIKIIPGNIVGPYFASGDTGDNTDPEDPGDPGDPNDPNKNAPDLSDISVISNTITYDSAGNPTATVVFKVRNSSGKTVSSVNARVQI
ncbi:MAG: hypothetical protein RLZZ196_20 [Bacteroidota bacterium]|jgi:hypothetical protein